MERQRFRVAVVGGGIAGLSAAWELACRGEQHVVVLEASGRAGGKLRTAEVGGHAVDLGPDAFLARRPEALSLCRELGIADELVAPGSRRAYVWSRRRLRALPDGLALGVPTRPGPVIRSGILSLSGLARASLDLLGRWAPGGSDVVLADRSVGDIVGRRLGRQVVERLVDPLVGGIHAGPVDELSAAAVFPPLFDAARAGGSLVRALRAVAPSGGSGDPVFLAPVGGLGRLVDALGDALVSKGVDLRTSSPVATLRNDFGSDTGIGTGTGSDTGTGTGTGPGRWLLSVGGAVPSELEADAVVLAAPAPETARLLAPLDSPAAAVLAAVPYASVALATFVFPASAVGRPLDGTGFLVPATEGWLTTACTWTTTKWPHLRSHGDVIVRVSTGRYGDDRPGALDDTALVSAVLDELRPVLELSAPPSAQAVTRWPDAFPQYTLGHLERLELAETRAAALGSVALAGAACRGVGIPACIGSGRRAARRVLGVDAERG
jgi:protoporphyrinogen/coproporphyrinogen III oxidase